MTGFRSTVILTEGKDLYIAFMDCALLILNAEAIAMLTVA